MLRARVLELGDEIAVHSTNLAHAYIDVAVAATENGAAACDAWCSYVSTLFGDTEIDSNVVHRFFALAPKDFLRWSHEDRDSFHASLRIIAKLSRRLAASYCDVFSGALASADVPDRADRLRAWADAAVSIAAGVEWRGEFLATHFIEQGSRGLTKLDLESVPLWARLFARIGSAGRHPKFPELPVALASLGAKTQSTIIGKAVDIAARDIPTAERFVRSVPDVLTRLQAPLTGPIEQLLSTCRVDSDVISALEVFTSSTRRLDADRVASLLHPCRQLARHGRHSLAPALTNLSRAVDEAGYDNALVWLRYGSELARENDATGVAYFRLESRTSRAILRRDDTAVTVEDIEPVIQRFATMLARRPCRLTLGPGVWIRPPLEQSESGRDAMIRVPDRIALFESVEDNRAFYKMIVALGAARFECGTYDFSFEEFKGRNGRASSLEPDGHDLFAFLDAFPNPLLASSLFTMLDGIRLDHWIAREFSGLSAELQTLGRRYVEKSPPSAREKTGELLIDALFYLSIGQMAAGEVPPHMRKVAERLEPTLTTLRTNDATVYTSADSLVHYYGLLSAAASRPPAGDVNSVDADGATLIDIYDDLIVGEDPFLPSGQSEDNVVPASRTEEEIVSRELPMEIDNDPDAAFVGGVPLTPEEIRDLIEQGVDLQISQGDGTTIDSLGLYVTDLLGKMPTETAERIQEAIAAGQASAARAILNRVGSDKAYYYDEWDYQIGDYRSAWCRLTEEEIGGDGGVYFNRLLSRRADLVSNVKREFLLMRPDQFRKVRGMEDGENIDLAAVVEAHVDRRRRQTPNERLYVARRREERDVATLFLVDMSASTDEPVVEEDQFGEYRRVIDVTKDTLIIMSSVLHEIGDAYAVYGFSGHGRDNVEVYCAKAFNESLGAETKSRLGGIAPKRSTRMGPALRHAAYRLRSVSARARHLILISDGFPQDYDYGNDRKSNVHGIRDTTAALEELQTEGVQTFCITIDPAGHDYLKEMCPASRYAVIDDIEVLPEELPRIYRSVTRA